MVDAGVLLGLPRPTAQELAVQTVLGAATMLSESGNDPVTLRAAVSSPAGTTVAAVRELEAHGLRAAFYSALEAARDRAQQLAP
jgi:pyrroline-5-carboxylate reductase